MYRIGKEEIAELTKVIETRSMFKVNSGLKESETVEAKLRDKFGVDHAIFLTSGQAALTSALVALGIGPGDEVIVPAYTYIATAMAVVAAGAIPVIAESDDTLTLDPVDTEKKISKHTKAIFPVHIQGFPCNMDAIIALAKKYNLFVIEDACQADGGAYKGKRLGTIGDAGGLSFNFFKIISSGEGGALLTNNRKVFEAALIYQDASAVAYFGNQLEDFTTEGFCGTEFRSNELCAAVMNVQLDRMDGILTDLRANKKYIMDALSDVAKFIPSNDIEGDCGTIVAFQFDSEEKARAFATANGVGGTVPIDTGKHIYKHWTPIMEKRGAFNPLMDPFKMEANKDILPDYHENMCPKTLDRLSKVVYVWVNPDDDKAKLNEKIALYRKALAEL